MRRVFWGACWDGMMRRLRRHGDGAQRSRIRQHRSGSEADIHPGDAILAVNGESIMDLAELWRRVWASGEAGAEIAMRLLRDGKMLTARIHSADRASYLKTPRVH